MKTNQQHLNTEISLELFHNLPDTRSLCNLYTRPLFEWFSQSFSNHCTYFCTRYKVNAFHIFDLLNFLFLFCFLKKILFYFYFLLFRAIERRVEIFQQFGRKFLRPRNVPGHSSFGSLISYGPSVENSCEGTYFPFIKKSLKDAVQGKGSWDLLQEELSLLLSSLIDIRTDT